MVYFTFVKSLRKVLFLVAEIHFLEQNCVRAVTGCIHAEGMIDSLIFLLDLFELTFSYCCYLLIFYLIISVQP